MLEITLPSCGSFTYQILSRHRILHQSRCHHRVFRQYVIRAERLQLAHFQDGFSGAVPYRELVADRIPAVKPLVYATPAGAVGQ